MKAIVVTDQAAGTPGMTLVNGPSRIEAKTSMRFRYICNRTSMTYTSIPFLRRFRAPVNEVGVK
jgi:hypothetical protein